MKPTCLSIAVLVLCVVAWSQAPAPPFAHLGGQYYPLAFAGWQASSTTPVLAPGVATVVVTPAQVSLVGNEAFPPVTVGVPVSIMDGAKSETITPMSVACSSDSCTVTADFAHTHPGGFRLASSNFGLNETIAFAEAHGGGTVVVSSNWYGTAAQISSATGSADVAIEDLRGGDDIRYRWSGTQYTISNPGGILYPDQFPGADIGAQMNAAIAALPSSGGELFIPSGTYTLSTPIQNNPTQPVAFTCAKGTTIIGNGVSIFANISGGSSIQGCTLGWTGAAIRNVFAINAGYGAWSSSTGFAAQAIVVPTIAHARGLFFEAGTTCTSGDTEPAWPVTLGGSVVDGTCTWTAAGVTKVTISHDTFRDWPGYQIINTGGYNYGWVIEDNQFSNSYAEAILAGSGTQHVLVSGNTIRNMGSNAIDFGGGDYNIAADNVIVDPGSNSSFGIDTDGIQMQGISGFSASGNRASGNIIIGAGQHGILYNGVTSFPAINNLASGNVIISPGLTCVAWNTNQATANGVILARDNASGNQCVNPGRKRIRD